MKRPLILVTALALTACGPSPQSVQDFMAQADRMPHGAIPALPESPGYEPVSYDAAELRDPFAPPPKPQAPRPPAERRDPLERYSLETLRMVGTLLKDGAMVALVRAPDGLVHQVRPGNRMGQNFGRITAITEAKITLEEQVPDGTHWSPRQAVVNLVEGA